MSLQSLDHSLSGTKPVIFRTAAKIANTLNINVSDLIKERIIK